MDKLNMQSPTKDLLLYLQDLKATQINVANMAHYDNEPEEYKRATDCVHECNVAIDMILRAIS